MKKKILVSVIMLTFNRVEMVTNMIKCILKQSLHEFEFIIVNNGSDDDTDKVLEKYKNQDSRIKIVNIEKSTIGKGRNVGLSYAKGEYIAFVDDDDMCDDEYLKCLYTLVKEERADIAICGTNEKTYKERKNYNATEALLILLERKYYNVGFPTKLIKRELYKKNFFNENSLYDDIYLMPRIIASANKIVYSGEAHYWVNRHRNNNSLWTTDYRLLTKDILEEYLTVYRERTKWLVSKFPMEEYAWKYYEWSFMLSMVNKIVEYKVKECYEMRDILIGILKNNREDFLNNPRIKKTEIKWMEKYICMV